MFLKGFSTYMFIFPPCVTNKGTEDVVIATCLNQRVKCLISGLSGAVMNAQIGMCV